MGDHIFEAHIWVEASPAVRPRTFGEASEQERVEMSGLKKHCTNSMGKVLNFAVPHHREILCFFGGGGATAYESPAHFSIGEVERTCQELI